MNELFYYTGSIFWIVMALGALTIALIMITGIIHRSKWFGWVSNWATLFYYKFHIKTMDTESIEKKMPILKKYLKTHDQKSCKMLIKLFEEHLNNPQKTNTP